MKRALIIFAWAVGGWLMLSAAYGAACGGLFFAIAAAGGGDLDRVAKAAWSLSWVLYLAPVVFLILGLQGRLPGTRR